MGRPVSPDRHRTARFLEAGAGAAFERAAVAVLPAPYEATVSWRGGAANGPHAILEASEQLELYDERTRSEPWRAGIWTAPPLELDGLDGPSVTRRIQARVGELLDADKWVVMLGGEHGVTVGGVRAAAQRHPGLRVLQLDAHADLRESYDGNRWSHACVAARCLESAEVRALGVRSYSAEEARRMRRGLAGHELVHAWEMNEPGRAEALVDGLAGAPVYLTVDVDYFDPSIVPATGTPEPGGAGWEPTLGLLERLFGAARVVATDVVELAPAPGLHHADFTVARLVYKLIGMYAAAARPG